MSYTANTKNIITEMIKAGVHLGHLKSKRSPGMIPYICTIRSNIHIINLEFTLKKLEEVLEFIKGLVKKGGIVLFVGTRVQSRKIVEESAKRCKMPHVSNRWIGGTFTNFGTISKRLSYLRDLEKRKKSGELKKYTRKEQQLLAQEIKKLNAKMGGIKELNKLPDAVFLLSAKENEIVIREAQKVGIPIIALVDTDVNPALVDYPIPSNDDAVSALKFMCDKVAEAILKVKEGKPNKKKSK